jgi:hypothetical protein
MAGFSKTAHTARESMKALSDEFRNRIIGSGIWHGCSPDLNPCNFFFWGCLKDKVYIRNSRTAYIKENIRRKITSILADSLEV